MIKGTVSDWKYQAKFGFIKSPEFEGEIFFHEAFTVDNQPLTIGDTVTFRLSRDDKGRRIAVDVAQIAPAPSRFEEHCRPTELCKNFMGRRGFGSCRMGDACPYAHGEGELALETRRGESQAR